MTFDTIRFCVFLSAMLLIYYCSPEKIRKYVIFVGNILFYISFDLKVAVMAVFTTAITYYSGLQIEKNKYKNKKTAFCWLTATVAAIILVLGIFKYLNFFVETINIVLKWFHANTSMPLVQLFAVIGISYYSLKAISYLVEVYKGNMEAERNFISYGDYILFFPQIVAGPIDKPESLISQINTSLHYKEDLMKKAVVLLASGYMKKLVIANLAAGYVNTVYGNTVSQTGLTCLFAAFLYSIQIYCDFSGYSDISIGLAAMFGIQVRNNFDCPYLSVNIKDFWRRWHISLSSFLRDYIYIPLGGSRKGEIKKIRNVLVIFLVSGLWHGAAWTFVFWGLYHGILNCLSKNVENIERLKGFLWIKRMVRVLGTFILVTLGWIFFRAESFGKAFEIIRKIVFETSVSIGAIQETILVFTGDSMSLAYFLTLVIMVFLLFFREYRYTYGGLKDAEENKREKEALFWTGFCVFAILCFGNFGTQGFIYANF